MRAACGEELICRLDNHGPTVIGTTWPINIDKRKKKRGPRSEQDETFGAIFCQLGIGLLIDTAQSES